MTGNRVVVVLAVLAMGVLSVTPAMGRGRPSSDTHRGVGAAERPPAASGDVGSDDRDPGPTFQDQVFGDDLVVQGSACVGFDCVNNESFGFDTVRLKENNLRITAVDTSSSASFPSQDWQLTFNDSTNGGQNHFSVEAITGPHRARPLSIVAGSNDRALHIDGAGRIGFGTNTPVTALHSRTNNTPTLRFEQDGSGGFTAQTWDMAGNESNFFIRDVTGGSALPFRIQPGAPNNTMYLARGGNVGLGTSAPGAALHLRRAAAEPIEIRLDAAGTTYAISTAPAGSPEEGLTLKMPGGQTYRFTPTGAMVLPETTSAAFIDAAGAAAPVAGMLYFDGNTFCGYDGTTFRSLQQGGPTPTGDQDCS